MSDPSIVFRGECLRPLTVAGELAGLMVGDELLPFPGVGLETELGVVVPQARGHVRPELQRLLAMRGGVPAGPRVGGSAGTWVEWLREFDELGSSYLEGDHFELNTWLHRSAAGARSNLEALLEKAGRLAARSRDPILLHATGGDGQGSTWGSLHVNVPISDRTYQHVLDDQRMGRLAYEWYLPAQLSLAVVDGNGGVGWSGSLLSDRLAEFDRVFGATTTHPGRCMVVDRAEGFGCARIMNMLRALSFGPASSAGLAATQLDCLIMELIVHDVLEVPSLALRDPVAAGREMARSENRSITATIQEAAQATRHRVLDALQTALGATVVETLLPGMEAHLALIDRTLDAVRVDDEAELIELCDWARKREVFRTLLGARESTWGSCRDELLELNVHYARLDDDALRHRFAGASRSAPTDASPVPEDTSSFLLHWLVEKARDDETWAEDLGQATLSWAGVATTRTCWLEPSGGYWPWAERQTRRLDLIPWSFTRRTHGACLQDIDDLGTLFDRLGAAEVICGDYAGRSCQPGHASTL